MDSANSDAPGGRRASKKLDFMTNTPVDIGMPADAWSVEEDPVRMYF
jgi:hypothetical protein